MPQTFLTFVGGKFGGLTTQRFQAAAPSRNCTSSLPIHTNDLNSDTHLQVTETKQPTKHSHRDVVSTPHSSKVPNSTPCVPKDRNSSKGCRHTKSSTENSTESKSKLHSSTNAPVLHPSGKQQCLSDAVLETVESSTIETPKNRKQNSKPTNQNNNISGITTTRVEIPKSESIQVEKLASSTTNDLSEYERKRQENIRRNLAFLASVGLSSEKPVSTTSAQVKVGKGRSKRKRTERRQTPTTLRRSSRRLANKDCSISSEFGIENNLPLRVVEHTEEDLLRLNFQTSSVQNYVCKGWAKSFREKDMDNYHESRGFGIGDQKQLLSCDIKKIYTINFNEKTRLLVAGGHQGKVSVFGLNCLHSENEGYIEPLLTYSAAKGWISSVQLLETAGSSLENPAVLTASNDGTLALWDLSQTASLTETRQVPKSICAISPHSGGIFSMQLQNTMVLTGSKDRTVGYSEIYPDGSIKLLETYDNPNGIVKSVAWSQSNPTMFASAGNDSVVYVYDRRTRSNVLELEPSNNFALNSVSINRYDETSVMCAGFGTQIDIFDTRQPSQPVQILNQHVVNKQRCSSIYHPSFVGAEGKYIMTPGEGTRSLSIYQNANIVLREVIDFDPTCIGYGKEAISCNSSSFEVALARGSTIQLHDVTL